MQGWGAYKNIQRTLQSPAHPLERGTGEKAPTGGLKTESRLVANNTKTLG